MTMVLKETIKRNKAKSFIKKTLKISSSLFQNQVNKFHFENDIQNDNL